MLDPWDEMDNAGEADRTDEADEWREWEDVRPRKGGIREPSLPVMEWRKSVLYVSFRSRYRDGSAMGPRIPRIRHQSEGRVLESWVMSIRKQEDPSHSLYSCAAVQTARIEAYHWPNSQRRV